MNSTCLGGMVRYNMDNIVINWFEYEALVLHNAAMNWFD